MANYDNNDLFDLGSAPISEDFDPFTDDELIGEATEKVATPQPQEQVDSAPVEPVKTGKITVAKDAKPAAVNDKPPVFVYAGATENIEDTSMTFDELRIEKARDFPELDDGKRVSWTVEYGKITKEKSWIFPKNPGTFPDLPDF